jgi:hypothetical protein
VFTAEVMVEHFAQKLFSFESVARKVESNSGTDRAGTIKEIIFWL